MDETNLLAVCGLAFGSVFLLLAILAGVIRLVTVVFPERPGRRIDPPVVAALGATAAVVYPGARVTRIVEEP
jgi:Na+-transporting methylmalonyl-CoA/oxaloacetate decarboxylase gamma subunit